MPIEVQLRGARLVATLTGTLDWNDIAAGFRHCAAWLKRDPAVHEVLFDLRTAKLDLCGIEADQLAELVVSIFPRPVTAAIVEPEALAGRELVVEFAGKLERLGLCVAICGSLKGAAKYLHALETGERPLPALTFLKQVKVEIERVILPQEMSLGR